MLNKKAILICLLGFGFLYHAKAQNPSVLLEFFSSEGCSSCPYADEFAHEIMRLSDSSHSPVYILDYHVDIWNKSGWVDSFSTAEFTKRQTDYMKKAGQEALFTPMVFVNGQYGLPAGEKKVVGQAIYKELVTAASVGLSLNANMLNNGKGISVSYQVSNRYDSMELVLVLAQREITSKVTGGENAGKILVHHQVARKMFRIPITNELTGIYEIPMTENMKLEDYTLIGFLQQKNSWRVLSTDQMYFRK